MLNVLAVFCRVYPLKYWLPCTQLHSTVGNYSDVSKRFIFRSNYKCLVVFLDTPLLIIKFNITFNTNVYNPTHLDVMGFRYICTYVESC